jgi:hypothetical protein
MRTFDSRGSSFNWRSTPACEAALMQVTGTRAEAPCTVCEDGRGPFEDCIVSSACGQGACATCHYLRKGSDCRIRRNLKKMGTVTGLSKDANSNPTADKSRKRATKSELPPRVSPLLRSVFDRVSQQNNNSHPRPQGTRAGPIRFANPYMYETTRRPPPPKSRMLALVLRLVPPPLSQELVTYQVFMLTHT